MNLSAIPQSLQGVPQWVCWRVETRDGKPTKPPLIPGTNEYAATNKPDTWRAFDVAAASVNGDGGVGFVLTPSLGIVGIDLDHCVDPFGKLAPYAVRIAERMNSYAERSPNDGVHILVKSTLPQCHKIGWLEMFDRGKYFTMTGQHIPGTPMTIEQAETGWLFRLMTARVFDFTKNPKLQNLMGGQWQSLYPSQSEADLALCSMLAGLGLPELDIDNGFRLSGLYREKWEREDYRSTTLQTALESTGKPIVAVSNGYQLLRTEGGTPRPVLENAVTLLRHSPEWAGVLAFDEFAGRATILKPAPGFSSTNYPRPWTDADDALTACWMQRNHVLVNSRVTAEAVQVVSLERPFHPVREYLRSLSWDGIERDDLWLVAYFEAPETEFVKAASRRWLISAVARIFQPGCQCDYTLLLEGGQGLGKSAGLRALVGDEYFSDRLSPLGSKDAFCELSGKWVIELSELTAMRRSEVESVKAFLTARIDHYRAPYAKRAQDVPRQCVFCASTNEQNPFTDSSGNRRFWPIRVGRVDVEALAKVRNQLWAEAYARYCNREVWWLESEELNRLAADEQKQRFEEGAWDQQILTWSAHPVQRHATDGISLPWHGSEANKVNLTDVLIHAIGLPLHQIKQADHRQAARALQHAGWTQMQERSGRNRGKRYYCRPPVCKNSIQVQGVLHGCSLSPGHSGECDYSRVSQ